MSDKKRTSLQCEVCKRLYPSVLCFQSHVKRSHGGLGWCNYQVVNIGEDDIPVAINVQEPTEKSADRGSEEVPETDFQSGAVENVLSKTIESQNDSEYRQSPTQMGEGEEPICTAPLQEDGHSFCDSVLDDDNSNEGEFTESDEFEDELYSYSTAIEPSATEMAGASTVNRTPLSGGEEVADKVFSFYATFGDSSDPLFPSVVHLTPSVEALKVSTRQLIDHCTRLQMTLGEAVDEWKLLERRESRLPEEHWEVKQDFDTAGAFRRYLDRARKFRARSEGWRKAIIRTKHGPNCTGSFRSTLELAQQKISACGGAEALQKYSEQYEDGNRVFSCPWNADALRKYSSSGQNIVLLDIFCDGTLLASGGSQSASPVRVRFSNLKGKSTRWYEVGILPIALWPESGKIPSRSAAERERLELFQRFIFLSFEDVILASAKGFYVDDSLLYFRVGMVVCDQKQERPFCSLKSAGTSRECTSCDMVSSGKRKRVEGPQHFVSSSEMESSLKRRRLRHVAEESRSDCHSGVQSSLDLSQAASMSYSVDNFSTREEVLHTQLCPTEAQRRDVCETVYCQLLVAESKRSGETRRRGSASALNPVSAAIKYLTNMSAHAFPPALAAFHGLGTWPFRLYTSLGFDKLHALDLGPLRDIPDNAFRLFSRDQYNHESVTQLVSTANQRLLDMPRAAKLPSIEVLKHSENQLQSGMTGKVRRDVIPFLGLAVMGLAKDVDPDKDDLVQVCLHFADINRRMSGINMPAKSSQRTLQDIEELQKSCFEAGRKLTRLFGKRVNTKVHRIMRHVKDHLVDHGCLRRGSTDENETLHRTTKRAYKSTNKHIDEISFQLVTARLGIPCTDEDQQALDPDADNPLLLTRDPLSTARREPSGGISTDEESENTDDTNDSEIELSQSEVLSFQSLLRAERSPEFASIKLASLAHVSTHQPIWKRRYRVRFRASFSWQENIKVWQTVHANSSGGRGRGTDSNPRSDSIEYYHDGVLRKGTLEAIYSSNTRKAVMAIVMRLTEVLPEPGNENIVYKFQNQRFGYALDESQKIVLDIVRVKDFRRQIMLVPDVFCVSKRYGIDQGLDRLPRALEDLRSLRFFELASYRYTSFPQSYC